MRPAALTAIVYQPGESIDDVIADVAARLRKCGWRLAGFIQINEPRGPGTRCDMTLQDLSSGQRLAISENRGREARGCMLDVAELVRGAAIASAALAGRPDLLILNKFGKTEASGRGFRSVMVDAIEFGVPVLTTVPVANLDAWQSFAGEFAETWRLADLPRDAEELCVRLGFGNRPAGNRLVSTASAH